MTESQLSNLVNMDSPEDVLAEVLNIVKLISPDYNFAAVESVFLWTIELYNGNHSGFRACNTEYHDLHHITDTFLAMTRLIHGALIDGESFTGRQIILGLIAALAHDTGYLQEEHDREGTGSKYTANHVQRSMDFLEVQGTEYGLSEDEIAACRTMILCTDLSADFSAIAFPSPQIELLSKMLGAADLLAQMADRTYLEKLLFLYYEFKEANVGDYASEVDLLRKTVAFYDIVAQRLENKLDSTDRYMLSHLACRWGIHENLYDKAILKQKHYLQQIMETSVSAPHDELRRNNIVHKVRLMYG